MNLFSNLGSWVKHEVAVIEGNPVVQNLEADFEALYSKIIGLVPWQTLLAKVGTSVTALVSNELTTVEAHNALLALAATFVPGGNAAVAQAVSSAAVAVAGNLVQALPIPATTAPAATPSA